MANILEHVGLGRSDVVTFLSSKAIPYGNQISILTPPEEVNGEWVAKVLISTDQLEEIRLESREIDGKRFIVLQCEESFGGNFRHRAIATGRFDLLSQEIEKELIRMLERP